MKLDRQHHAAALGEFAHQQPDHRAVDLRPSGDVRVAEHRAAVDHRDCAEAECDRLHHHQRAADDLLVHAEQDRLRHDRAPAPACENQCLLLGNLVEVRDAGVPLVRSNAVQGE